MNSRDSAEESFKKIKEAFETGHFSRVVNLFSEMNAETLPPKTKVELLYMAAISLNEVGEHEEAIRKIKQAIVIFPSYGPAILALGTFYEEEGKYHLAIAKYRAATKADHILWEAFYHWAYLLKKLGSPKAAARKFRKVLELNPDHSESYIHAGDCAFQLERFKEALSLYELAMTKSEPSSEILTRIGNTFLLLGDRGEAIHSYESSIKLDPLEGSGYENWGLLLRQEGKLEEAARKYEEGLIYAPESPTLLLRHGEVLAKLEKFHEALLPLEKAYDILVEKVQGEWGTHWGPILADCAYILGYVKRKTGDEANARECFHTTLRYVPNHLNALQELALLRGVYREHHVKWEFVLEGKVNSEKGRVTGLRAYRVAALTLDEAMGYAKECEEEISENLKAKDVSKSEQVASYAGVLARGPLFLLSKAS